MKPPSRMRRIIKLTLLFYRSWATAGLFATAVCVWIVAMTSVSMLPFVLFFKAVVSALVWYVTREYGARKIYYFTNLGMSPCTLWGLSLSFDIIIFAICMTAAILL